jgi:predicted RNA-binding protein with PIN domain
MRVLIDGYNVMHAGGLIQPQIGGSGRGMRGAARTDAFRKSRNRFLNLLAATLDEVEAYQTTIVFDAALAPPNLPSEQGYKGMTVIFAVDDDSADDRIESMIRNDKTPKTLVVVSSDRRLRAAGERRGAKVLSADDYWTKLDLLKEAKERKRGLFAARTALEPKPTDEEIARDRGLTEAEARLWRDVFREVVADSEFDDDLAGPVPLLDEDELARIAREIDSEDKPFGKKPRR